MILGPILKQSSSQRFHGLQYTLIIIRRAHMFCIVMLVYCYNYNLKTNRNTSYVFHSTYAVTVPVPTQ